MPELLKPDLCVLGAGPEGVAVALGAAALGVPVVLVDGGETFDEALRRGPLARQALLAAAGRFAGAQAASAFAGAPVRTKVDFSKVRAHIAAAVARAAPEGSPERLAGLGVRVLHGPARFTDRRTVAVGGEITIRARRFVVATGTRPKLPAVPGIDGGPTLTPDTLQGLSELPPRLVVLGAGQAGCALAQAFHRFGSSVTVLEQGEPLAGEDREAVDVVLRQLARDGIVLRHPVTVTGITHGAGNVGVNFTAGDAAGKAEGTHLIVAAGRVPAVAGLELDAARIRHDDGGIAVDRNLKTSNGRVYALGGVAAGDAGRAQDAAAQAAIVLQHALFRRSVAPRDRVLPRVVSTAPELAQTGLTEEEALARSLKIRVARWPVHDSDRARADGVAHGHIKVVTSPKGQLFGVTIVGPGAGEMIVAWSLALSQKLNLRVLAGQALPYPVYAEIGRRAAFDFFAPDLTRSWVRRIIRWLRILG